MELYEDYAEALYLTGWFQAEAGYPISDTEETFDYPEELECVQAGYDDYMESIR